MECCVGTNNVAYCSGYIMVSTNEVFNVRSVALSNEIRFQLWDTVTFTVLYVDTTNPYPKKNRIGKKC